MLLSPLSADLTQLHTLWKDVFGDEDGYIDLFFSGAYVSSHPFAVVEDGEVQSVLYLLDCALQSGSKLYDGYYLYAAATKPQYRRRGLMRSLIEEAKDYMRETKKDFIALVPANAPLYNYYHTFGFEPCLYRWAGTIRGTGKQEPASLSFAQYGALTPGKRDRFLWTNGNLQYALDCLAFYGTKAFRTDNAAFLFDGRTVREVLSPSAWDAQFDLTAALPKDLTATVYAPFALSGFQKQPYGMLFSDTRALLQRQYYMNFALD